MNEETHPLDDTTIAMFNFKTGQLTKAVLAIAKRAYDFRVFWPDEICDEIALDKKDANCIGIAYRILGTKLDLIHKTGRFRKSTAKRHNGCAIFEYSVNGSRLHVLRALLKRHGVSTVDPNSNLLFDFAA